MVCCRRTREYVIPRCRDIVCLAATATSAASLHWLVDSECSAIRNVGQFVASAEEPCRVSQLKERTE